jgi:RIO-like serine/threonine protein kinase
MIYPPECDIPSEWRLTGKQQGIMLEYVEGEMLTENNFRPELQKKVLDAYDALLNAGVIHGDSSVYMYVRNVIITPGGQVVWIDFERATVKDLHEETEDPRSWENIVDELGELEWMCLWETFQRW